MALKPNLTALPETTIQLIKPNFSAPHFRILLVEDDPPSAMLACTILEMCGYPFDAVTTGHEAVKKVKTGAYAVVLMDLVMDDMDGMEATRLIRENEHATATAPVHIICLTASAMLGERESCLSAGMDDYLTKPYHIHEVKDKLAVQAQKYAARR